MVSSSLLRQARKCLPLKVVNRVETELGRGKYLPCPLKGGTQQQEAPSHEEPRRNILRKDVGIVCVRHFASMRTQEHVGGLLTLPDFDTLMPDMKVPKTLDEDRRRRRKYPAQHRYSLQFMIVSCKNVSILRLARTLPVHTNIRAFLMPQPLLAAVDAVRTLCARFRNSFENGAMACT